MPMLPSVLPTPAVSPRSPPPSLTILSVGWPPSPPSKEFKLESSPPQPIKPIPRKINPPTKRMRSIKAPLFARTRERTTTAYRLRPGSVEGFEHAQHEIDAISAGASTSPASSRLELRATSTSMRWRFGLCAEQPNQCRGVMPSYLGSADQNYDRKRLASEKPRPHRGAHLYARTPSMARGIRTNVAGNPNLAAQRLDRIGHAKRFSEDRRIRETNTVGVSRGSRVRFPLGRVLGRTGDAQVFGAPPGAPLARHGWTA